MKNQIRKILALILLITVASSQGFTQTSDSKTVGKDKIVAFLIQENKSAREVIARQDDRIKDLEELVEAERENSASISKSYTAAQGEIESLRQSNAALDRAVKLNESTIALLQEDNARQREKARKAEKAKWHARLIAAGAIALKFLL